MRNAVLFSLSLGILFLASCGKEKKEDEPPKLPEFNSSRVLVLCEGNFQWGNADFDLYLEDSMKVYSEVYKRQNQGSSLGDVLQSGGVIDSMLWLVVNNSGKLIGLEASGFGSRREINGLKSPRYMLPVGGGEAWVTDLYSNQIARVDLVNQNVKSYLPCWGWTENLCMVGSEIAAASSLGRVHWFDKNGTASKDSTMLRTGSRWLQKDKRSDLWVLASDSGKTVLYKIPSGSHQIAQQFNISGGSMKLAMNKAGDSLFFLNDGVFAMSIDDVAVPTSPVFHETGFSYYGLGVNPNSGQIYVANARDYVSKGEVVVLRSNGAVVNRFATGINPGEFVFLE
jgi:hypothetical protein